MVSMMMASGTSSIGIALSIDIGITIGSSVRFATWASTLVSSEILGLNVYIYFSLNSIIISVSVMIIVEVV